MSEQSNQKTRRNFLVGTGAAGGAMALASVAAAAGDAQTFEINAMMPMPEQMQAFMSLEHDGPVVMVNLLKFYMARPVLPQTKPTVGHKFKMFLGWLDIEVHTTQRIVQTIWVQSLPISRYLDLWRELHQSTISPLFWGLS